MKMSMLSSARALALAAAGSALLALAVPQALAQTAGSGSGSGAPARGAEEQITWGGKSVPAATLVGKPVMMKGEKIGEVADLIWRDNTYNDVVIRLDKEHSQMGVVANKESQRMAGNQPPAAVGGRTLGVRLDSLKPAQDGKAVMLDESAVTTLKDFSYDPAGKDNWTTRNNTQRR